MAFIGKIFSGIGNAVKSFATSGLGKMLIGTAARAFGGPIGGILADAATNLLSGKKLNLKDILSSGLKAFAPMAGKLAGGLIDKLPSALKAPIGNLVGNFLNTGKLDLGSVAKTAGSILGKTSLGQKITGVLGKAGQLLGMGTKVGMDAQGVLGSISKLLGNFGVNTGGLDNASNFISKVLAGAGKVNDILGKIGGFLNPQPDAQMLRA